MKLRILLFSTLTIGLAACEPEGPAERLGSEIDQAAYQAEDVARDAAQELEAAGSDVGNAIEDACEDVTDRNC